MSSKQSFYSSPYLMNMLIGIVLVLGLAACGPQGSETPQLETEKPAAQIPRFKFESDQSYIVIEFLDDDLVHFELSAVKPSPGLEEMIKTTPMVVKTDYSGPSTFADDGEGTLETADLRIQIDQITLCITATDKSREPDLKLTQICPWNLEQDFKGFTLTTENFTHAYGLGQKFTQAGTTDGDWIGQQRFPGEFGNVMQSFDNASTGNTQFPVAYFTGEGTDSYALFLDNQYKQLWDFSHEPWKAVMRGDWLRFYIMSGPDLQDLRKDYMELVGHPPVPPKKMFGLWVSEYGYENWEEMEDKLRTLREHRFPIDGFILDLQWFGGIVADSDDTQEGSLTWDIENFPAPEEKIASLREEEGLGIVLIEQSYIGRNLPEHDDLEEKGYLVRECETCSAVYLTESTWWGKGSMIDWSNPAARNYWHDWKREPLIEDGVLGHWTDLGEPEIYDPDAWYWGIAGDYEPLHDHEDVHNLYNFLWSQSIYEGYERNGHTQRPFILSRSGAPGSQRYGVAMWSGDIAGSLTSLAAHLNAQMHMSMSGMDYYGADIGGFWRQEVDWDETYTQWFANGTAFDVPVRPHVFNLGNYTETAPDRMGDLESNLENLRLRYALSPYLYSLAHRAYRDGEPVFPPLVYYYQDDSEVRELGGEKLIGRDLLVVGVAESGEVERMVYLPQGSWTDFHTGERFLSTGEWFGPFSLYPAGNFRLPMFAKAGAIIPMMYVDDTTMNITGRRLDGSVRDELLVRVFPDDIPTSFTLYEDDGVSNAYQKGAVRTTVISQLQSGNEVKVTIAAASGSFNGAPSERDNQVELYVATSGALMGVTLNGESLPYFDTEAGFLQATSGWYAIDTNSIMAKTGRLPVGEVKELVFNFSSFSTEAPSVPGAITPSWPTEDWETTSPEQLGIDSGILIGALDFIQEEDVILHNLLIARNGYLVADVPIYRLTAGLASDHLAPTRVVIATLVGLAVEQGYIDGVDQSVLDFFSDREIDRLSAEKEAITVEHLLTMTSGLDCEKFEDRISQSDDWVQIILDLPMEDEPGTVFGECNANTHLLSAILQQVTGVNAFAYAQTALFEPLGIEVATWRSDPLGVSLGWQGLEMDPSETAKIGLLYLRDGVWENQRLLSKDWVRSSLPAMTHSGYGGLGYQWQEDLVGIYAAGDGRGQWIVLEPEKDVIFVFTAGQREQDALSMRILLHAFLIESMHPSPLPENQAAATALTERIKEIGKAPEPMVVPDLPETANRITGNVYLVDENPLEWEQIELSFPAGDEAFLTLKAGGVPVKFTIGLDEVFRVPKMEFDLPDDVMVAQRGRWISENEFVIEYDFIYFRDQGTLHLIFEDNRLTVRIEGAPVVITGRLKE